MTKEALDEAISEAERFLKKAKAVQWESPLRLNGQLWQSPIDLTQTAAAKRASMDLTRALAKMRKP